MNDWNSPIENISPHYTNTWFKTPRIVWGKDDQSAQAEYSDRLVEWDYEKHKMAYSAARGRRTSAEFYQNYLSLYFGKPIELIGIMAGFNLGNGYPYQIFIFREAQQ